MTKKRDAKLTKKNTHPLFESQKRNNKSAKKTKNRQKSSPQQRTNSIFVRNKKATKPNNSESGYLRRDEELTYIWIIRVKSQTKRERNNNPTSKTSRVRLQKPQRVRYSINPNKDRWPHDLIRYQHTNQAIRKPIMLIIQ